MEQVEFDFGPYCHSCGLDLSYRAYLVYNNKSYCGRNCVLFKEKPDDTQPCTYGSSLVQEDRV